MALLKSGKSYRTVATMIGASLSSVVLWARAYRRKGTRGLAPKPTLGRRPELSSRQKAQLERILLRGPLQAGYATDLWTLKRVAEVIEDHFQVRYHHCHVWKILRAMDWSCQKPERRDRRRDELAIQRWKRYKWPRIKKKPNNSAPISFSLMKAAFYSFRI